MNLLWSYAYARRTDLEKTVGSWPVDRVRFFADSGAHSARTLGIHLDVDDYAAWLHKWHHLFTIYANLDVIYGPTATYANQRALEDRGLSPMPVFHTGEPWSALERYLDEGYTYIALGKLLGNPWKVLRPWLAQAFRMAEGTAVFHGFGLTSWQAIRSFPFYSVDSTSWTSPYRWGVLTLFDSGRWVTIKLRDRSDVIAHRRLLEDYGADLRLFTHEGRSRKKIAALSAEAYVRAGEWAKRQHGPILLPPGKGYPTGPLSPRIQEAGGSEGFTLYLAEGGDWSHRAHAEQIAARQRVTA